MRRTALGILTVLTLLAPTRVAAQDNGDGTYTNPPLHADYPDPDIIRVCDDFYFVSTTFVNSPGLVMLHSKDLVNWETVGYVIDRLEGDRKYDMDGGTAYRSGVFAPSLRYHKGTFYVAVTPNGKPCGYRKRRRSAGFGGKSVRRRCGGLAGRGGVADRFPSGW